MFHLFTSKEDDFMVSSEMEYEKVEVEDRKIEEKKWNPSLLQSSSKVLVRNTWRYLRNHYISIVTYCFAFAFFALVIYLLLPSQSINYVQLSNHIEKLLLTLYKSIPVVTFLNVSNIPKQIQPGYWENFKLIESESNIAALYWLDWNSNKTLWESRDSNIVDSITYCEGVEMIEPNRINYSNLYWQMVEVSTEFTVYLYNAYYDNRTEEPVVKVITATNQQIRAENNIFWCLLWFDELRSPILSPLTNVHIIWSKQWVFGIWDGVWGPQIMTCPVPKSYRNRIPRAISIQSHPDCTPPTNVLRVIHNKRDALNQTNRKPSIGVCVQAFRFGTYDVSVRLIEWLEMVRIMGGEKVYFYVYGATESMYSVLRHYANEGLVDWRHLTLPGDQPNLESLYQYYYGHQVGKFWPQELLELNDCLYRNIYRHDYIMIFDIDEMIVPQGKEVITWQQLLERIEFDFSDSDRRTVAYLRNQHALVYEAFEDFSYSNATWIPEYLYMMRHTYREKVLWGNARVKCFHRTQVVSTVHNHLPLKCIGSDSCSGINLSPTSQSLLMHYRRNRSPPSAKCRTIDDAQWCTVHDTTLWQYAKLLEPAVKNKLETIFTH